MKDLLRIKSLISTEIEALLNQQVKKEAYSSSVYLSMASWCNRNGYDFSSDYFFKQAEEERLRKAVEENRLREEEENKRKAEEQRIRAEKEEKEKKAKEEAEKQRLELEERLKRDEEERLQRKKVCSLIWF